MPRPRTKPRRVARARQPFQSEEYHGRKFQTKRISTFSSRNQQTGEKGRMRAGVTVVEPPIHISNYDLEAQHGEVVRQIIEAADRGGVHEFYTRWHNRYPRAQLVLSGRAKLRDEAKHVGYEVPTHVPEVNHIHFSTFVEQGVNDVFHALKKKEKYLVWFDLTEISIRFYDHVRIQPPRVP